MVLARLVALLGGLLLFVVALCSVCAALLTLALVEFIVCWLRLVIES